MWADIPNRPKWDDDTEWAKANGPFQNGTIISMKPKGWPKVVNMEIVECVQERSFTDHTKFFLASLFGTHTMEPTSEGLKLTTTIKVTGPLAFFWRKVVAEDIVKTLPQQTALLIERAKKLA
ncbi:MAG: polyketide cyclase [Proteobacteria bacterium]|nr:polyketide cyclase [Pseudomonadota bacterium]